MKKSLKNKLNIIGHKYARLTVIKEIFNERKGRFYECLCDCGKTTIVSQDELRGNLKGYGTKSCGCFNIEKCHEKMGIEDIEKMRKYPPKEATARYIFNNSLYKDGNLTFEQFYDLIREPCFYCGEPHSNKTNAFLGDRNSEDSRINGELLYNGLDRIDSCLKHDLNNVVPCCKWCNISKRERSVEEFRSWIVEIYNYFVVSKK